MLWFAIIGGFIVAVVLLNGWFPAVLGDKDNWLRLLYLGILVAVFSAGAVYASRRTIRKGLLQAAAWAVIAALLLLGYTYRHQLANVGRNVLSAIVPGVAQENGARELMVRLSKDGHFQILAEVNGVPVRFMVDTGASDVILSPADARRLGYTQANLNFSKRYRTANGVVKGAPVRLSQISIGRLVMKDVEASVNGAGMASSLLGMSFLSRLRGYQVDGDRLILRW